MDLIRLITVYLDTHPKQLQGYSFDSYIEDVRISVLRQGAVPNSSKYWYLIASGVILESSLEVDEGIVFIPPSDRARCERGAEKFANLLSVIGRTGKSVSSPRPFIALNPTTTDEQRFLETLNGYKDLREGIFSIGFEIGWDEKIINIAARRWDGVALLSEFLSNHRSAGKFREFVRFVELAFALSFDQCRGKLSQFLTGSPYDFTNDEIRYWIDLRHAAIHADGKRTKSIVFERDLAKYVKRMELAAYDILLNKKEWHKPSRVREEIWRSNCHSIMAGRSLSVEAHSRTLIHTQLFDPFGIYPMDLATNLLALPENWWSKTMDWPVGNGIQNASSESTES